MLAQLALFTRAFGLILLSFAVTMALRLLRIVIAANYNCLGVDATLPRIKAPTPRVMEAM